MKVDTRSQGKTSQGTIDISARLEVFKTETGI